MKNVIKKPGYSIVIQSCDESSANIGVFEDKSIFTRKSFYADVEVPSLKRTNDSPQYQVALDKVIFDEVLATYRDEVVALVHNLAADTQAASEITVTREVKIKPPQAIQQNVAGVEDCYARLDNNLKNGVSPEEAIEWDKIEQRLDKVVKDIGTYITAMQN